MDEEATLTDKPKSPPVRSVTFDEDVTEAPRPKAKADDQKFLGRVVFFFLFCNWLATLLISIELKHAPTIVLGCVAFVLYVGCLLLWLFR